MSEPRKDRSSIKIAIIGPDHATIPHFCDRNKVFGRDNGKPPVHTRFCGALRSLVIASSWLRSDGVIVMEIPVRRRQTRARTERGESGPGLFRQAETTSNRLRSRRSITHGIAAWKRAYHWRLSDCDCVAFEPRLMVTVAVPLLFP
jgi:hypothetical protein